MARKHERVNVSLDVVLEMSSGKHEARVSDLSMSGCFVDTIINAQSGERIVFKLKMPAGEWLELPGEVRHHLPGFGFGIRFINVPPEKKDLLEQIIRARGGDPSESGGA